MIYLFQGVQGICSLPGTMCKGCGELCAMLECTALRDGCSYVGRLQSQFMERPLSTYLLVAWALSAVDIFFCWKSLDAQPVCVFPEGAYFKFGAWVYCQIGFAILNIAFAPYFQCQVWRQILVNMAASLDGSLRHNPSPEGKKEVPAKDVKEAFIHVFKFDFGVLFYFFALLAMFASCMLGQGWVSARDGESCSPNGPEGYVYWLGMVFFWVATLYTFLWYCCDCCAKSVQIDHDAFHEYEIVPTSEARA